MASCMTTVLLGAQPAAVKPAQVDRCGQRLLDPAEYFHASGSMVVSMVSVGEMRVVMFDG